MLKALIKKQIYEVFSSYSRGLNTRGNARKKAMRSLGMTLILMGVIFGFLGFSFYMIFDNIYPVMIGTPIEWMYFGMAALISILFGTLGSVFSTYSSLYLPKDNDILLALPIRPSLIILSRMIGVYAMSLMYTALLWVPAMICYYVHAVGLTLVTVVYPIFMLVILSLFVQVLTCFFGWLVAMAASRMKGKSFMTVFISLLFLGVYYYFYFQLMDNLDGIASQLSNIGTIVKSRFYPIYMISQAAGGDTVSLLILGGCVLALFVLCVMLISLNYTRILSMAAFTRKVKYTEKAVRRTSLEAALLRKEFKHFASSATWMLNGALGLLILLALSIFAVIKSGEVSGFLSMFQSEVPEIFRILPAVLTALVCTIISMNAISAPSVSLEGKTLWILQSLPADPWKIIQAKERMHVILCTVVMIPSVMMIGFVLKLDALIILLVMAVSFLYIWFEADLGIVMDLVRPNLKWNTEAEVVKKGLPVFTAIFGGMLLAIGIGALGVFMLMWLPQISALLTLLPSAVLLGLGVIAMNLWLRKKGIKKFMNL